MHASGNIMHRWTGKAFQVGEVLHSSLLNSNVNFNATDSFIVCKYVSVRSIITVSEDLRDDDDDDADKPASTLFPLASSSPPLKILMYADRMFDSDRNSSQVSYTFSVLSRRCCWGVGQFWSVLTVCRFVYYGLTVQDMPAVLQCADHLDWYNFLTTM